MTPAAEIGYIMVPLYGAAMCALPAVTRPTLQFGVRIPPARIGAAVIRRERRAYYWRSAAVTVCATTAVIVWGSGSWWPSRMILALEIAADVCFIWLARRKIIAVKTAERWSAGLPQTVVADTSWRTQPQRFPVRWLIPAIVVIAATIGIGVARYPHLPAHLATGLAGLGSRQVRRSPFSAFDMVIGQLFVTGLGTGMLALVYRSRPDIDAADPAASLRRYRRLLDGYTRAALTLVALVDLTLALVALQRWELYPRNGTSTTLLLVPAATGVLILIGFAMRAGRNRIRLASNGQRPGRAPAAGRDDDRFWKAGLIYVNRADPAIVVPARIGVGWALNFGNPAAWLIMGVIITTVADLAVLRIAAGM